MSRELLKYHLYIGLVAALLLYTFHRYCTFI
jgi:hypothetical protein